MTTRRAVLVDPLDVDAARRFFAAYEAGLEPGPGERLKYLQLKCLHDPSPWRWLNEVGRHFADHGRPSSAFLCFIESLSLNSHQPEVFGLCESLQSAVIPPVLRDGPPTGCSVSVIIPTYNRGTAIRESLLSVLQQTCQDFEVIVVNDGGNDAAEAVIRDLDDLRIRYCRLDRNLGKSSARNLGIQTARGRYIAFLDDDDVYLPDHLEALLRELRDGDCKVAYASTRAVVGRWDGDSFIWEEDGFVWNERFDRDGLLTRLYITTCSIMLEREVFKTTGLFTSDLHISQDWDLWLRCALAYPFRHVDKVTCEYRLSSQNSTIADRSGAYLFGRLVTRYHALFRGVLAYTAYFAATGDRGQARRCYEMLLAQMPGYFRDPRQLEAIAAVARTMGDPATARSATREYFQFWPRECLRSAARIPA